LALAFASLQGCDRAQGVASWFGASDKAVETPVVADILCDASRGSTCTARTLANVMQLVLPQVAGRPAAWFGSGLKALP
jgi:hypothetical protein